MEAWHREGIQGTTIYRLLVRSCDFAGGYSAERRFVRKLDPGPAGRTIRLRFEPGEAAQVDFGSGPKLPDPDIPDIRLPIRDFSPRGGRIEAYLWRISAVTITDEREEELHAAKLRAFLERATAFVRQAFPKQTEPFTDEQVAAAVEMASQKATGYGLRSGVDHIRYLGLMYSLGHDFDVQGEWSWIRKILDDPHLIAEEKMPKILEGGAARVEDQEASERPSRCATL